jgi:hypothetical protein
VPSFDGGCRTPIPVRGDPGKEHGELIVRLARAQQLQASGGWFTG